MLSLTTGQPASGSETGMVCIPNISPREQRKRLAGGVSLFTISLVVLTVLVARGANRWWRLPLFLFFWGAATGFFQWRDKT
jgi:hypothetical protein